MGEFHIKPLARADVTPILEDARTYAAFYFPEPHEPGGDLYEVEPIGLLSPRPV